jgi:hypothetical protein
MRVQGGTRAFGTASHPTKLIRTAARALKSPVTRVTAARR